MKDEVYLYSYEVYRMPTGLQVKRLVSLDEMELDKTNATMFHLIGISRVQPSNLNPYH